MSEGGTGRPVVARSARALLEPPGVLVPPSGPAPALEDRERLARFLGEAWPP